MNNNLTQIAERNVAEKLSDLLEISMATISDAHADAEAQHKRDLAISKVLAQSGSVAQAELYSLLELGRLAGECGCFDDSVSDEEYSARLSQAQLSQEQESIDAYFRGEFA